MCYFGRFCHTQPPKDPNVQLQLLQMVQIEELQANQADFSNHLHHSTRPSNVLGSIVSMIIILQALILLTSCPLRQKQIGCHLQHCVDKASGAGQGTSSNCMSKKGMMRLHINRHYFRWLCHGTSFSRPLFSPKSSKFTRLA